MDFQGSQTLAMPLQEAWNFLADVNNVVSCVPGLQKLDEVATNQWKAVIGISVGFVRASFPVEITRPVVEEQRRIAFRASGKASGSSVEMSGDMMLVATGNGVTRMDWKTTVNVGGLLARVPAGILASTMERGSNTFFDALTKQMESSGKQGSASAILAPVAMAMSTPAPIAPSAAIAVPATASPLALDHFMWRWPWYLIAGLAAIGMGLHDNFVPLASSTLASSGLLIFALLALLIMLIERTPEALIVPAGLAALAIWRLQASLQASISISLLASSLLCVLIFASRFLWNGVTAKQRLVSPAWFPVLLALGGQLAVIGIAIAGGSLTSHTSLLIYAGATTLLIFTLLILWSASLLPGRPALRRWCYYCAGLLIGLCISWCLLAFVSSDSYEYFTIAPAVSLSVIAPFLIRDKTLPGYRQIGQAVAIIATIALLLPTAAVGLQGSGSSQNLIPVELFMLEAVALFLLGLLTRTQIFTYGGATLVVLGVFSAFSFFITKATPSQQTSIIASIVIYAIICVAASIFFVSRDRRKKE